MLYINFLGDIILIEDCVFCKIIRGELDAYKIYEDDMCLAILDRFPDNIGHSLVITKLHVKTIFELEDDISSNILKIARKVAIAIQKSLNPDGMHLLQNNNKGANQTVDHFHLHVIPRFYNDTIKICWINNKFTSQEFLETQTQIKKYL